MIHFNTLENCSLQELVKAFNYAFKDYEIPFNFEEEAFERKLKVENFSPKHSIGAFNDHNDLIGFIIHCSNSDNTKLYNSGTGVFPEYRGEKITQKMYDFGLKNGLFNGVQEIILEVLVNNLPAYKSYLNIGFKLNRHFASYNGFPKNSFSNRNVQKLELTKDILAQIYTIGGTKPSWQNDFFSMELSKDYLEVYATLDQNKIVGYLLYNPLAKRIHQIAVLKDYRNQGIGTSLIQTLYQENPFTFTMINVDQNDIILNKWLISKGFETLVMLDELLFELK